MLQINSCQYCLKLILFIRRQYKTIQQFTTFDYCHYYKDVFFHFRTIQSLKLTRLVLLLDILRHKERSVSLLVQSN
jgi:hypothetical protein